MQYTWVKESLQKYGEEVTSQLVKQQQAYEIENRDNDCTTCGRKNEGAPIEWEKGKPFIMHFGIWVDDYCKVCGKHMDE
ncbi:hypothetical protein MZM54_00120 [[Brevibacterium] frigoritolerans]|nr:hypothetical protein [Peribacillus frigoritolerans]